MNAAATYQRTAEPRRRAHGSTSNPIEHWLLVLIAVGLVIATFTASARHTPGDVRTETVVVAQGQSLWTIAKAHPVKGMSTEQTVELIRTLNDGHTGETVPGDVLLVPSQPLLEDAVAMRMP